MKSIAICCCCLLLFLSFFAEEHLAGFLQAPPVSTTLPCRMPRDGYLITPDRVGIFVPAGTPISFFPNAGNERDGQLYALFFEEQLYRAVLVGNGTFLGYKNGVGARYSQSGRLPERQYYLGTVEEHTGSCSCILFPYFGAFAATADGVDVEKLNPPQGYPPQFPQAPGVYPHPRQILIQPTAGSFCPKSPDFLAALPGQWDQVRQQLAGLPAFLTQNGYRGKYLLHDAAQNSLQIYEAGRLAVEVPPADILALLEAYRKGQAAEEASFAILVELPEEASGQISIDVQIAADFLKAGPSYTALPGAKPFDPKQAEQLIKKIIREKIAALNHLGDPALEAYQSAGAGEDGQLMVRQAGLLRWIGFTLNEANYLIKNAKVNPALWNEEEAAYGHKLINLYAPVAGVADQALLEMRDLYELVDLLGQVCQDPAPVVDGIYTFVTNLDGEQVKKMVGESVSKEIEALRILGPPRQYKLAGYSTQAAFLIFAWTKGGSKLVLEFVEDVSQSADEIVKFVKRYGDEFGKAFQKLDPKLKQAFFEDFKDLPEAGRRVLEGDPKLVQAWKAVAASPGLRKDLDKLDKVSRYSDDFGKRFDDITDEFEKLPEAQRAGWIEHLAFRTKDGRVPKAGGQGAYYKKFLSNEDVPIKYHSDSRFGNLATDPSRGGKIDSKARQEAMAGLEAESQGLIKEPIMRDPSGNFEFIDGRGQYWDVKGPRGGFLNVDQAGDAIKQQLLSPGVNVILDCTWIQMNELNEIRVWLQQNLSVPELNRIIEVNSNLH